MNLEKKDRDKKFKDFLNVAIQSIRKSDNIVLIFIIGVAFFYRLWQISVLPPGVAAAEVEVINTIKTIGPGSLWLNDKFSEGAYVYTALVVTKIFGLKVLTLRLMSAFLGVATVVLGYVFISQWFSKKVAAFSAFLFSISFIHVSASRLIFPEIMLPLDLLALFVVLTEAYRRKNIWLFGISGAILGLGFYTSPVFIIMPILFFISGIYFFFRNKKFILNYKQELLIAGLGYMATSIPFVVSAFYHPNAYAEYFRFNNSFFQIILNIGESTRMLFISSPVNYFINIGSEPIFDPFVFISGLAGLLFAIIFIKRRKHFFLILWLLIFSFYAILKRGTQITDLFGLLPVFFTFSALILDYVLEMWFKTFPNNKRAKFVAIGVISIFFALSALYNFDRYFVAYKNSEKVKQQFSAPSPIPYN